MRDTGLTTKRGLQPFKTQRMWHKAGSTRMILHAIRKENKCMKMLGCPHSSSSEIMLTTSSEKRQRQVQDAWEEATTLGVKCMQQEAHISDSSHFWQSCDSSVQRVLDTFQLHISDEAGAETISVLKRTLDPVKDHLFLLRHPNKHHCIDQSHLIDLTNNRV